jgi:hypothetical protein
MFLHRRSGEGLFNHYRSLQKALEAAYPEASWQFWKFDRVANNSWSNLQNMQQYLVVYKQYGYYGRYIQYLGAALQVQKLDDWYRVSQSQISELDGKSLIMTNGGLGHVLKK